MIKGSITQNLAILIGFNNYDGAQIFIWIHQGSIYA